MNADVKILEATCGTPAVAVCTVCDLVWRRPAGDPYAQTLAVWALDHDCIGVNR